MTTSPVVLCPPPHPANMIPHVAGAMLAVVVTRPILGSSLCLFGPLPTVLPLRHTQLGRTGRRARSTHVLGRNAGRARRGEREAEGDGGWGMERPRLQQKTQSAPSHHGVASCTLLGTPSGFPSLDGGGVSSFPAFSAAVCSAKCTQRVNRSLCAPVPWRP